MYDKVCVEKVSTLKLCSDGLRGKLTLVWNRDRFLMHIIYRHVQTQRYIEAGSK